VILTDTGPLIALIDQDDSNHEASVRIAGGLPAGPLLTTWPCLTEAMYLLGSVGGYAYQAPLWQLLSTNRLILHDASGDERLRMQEFMERYQDRPMDLADASLMAAAERLRLHEIFAFDSDFHIYRQSDGSVLKLLG
jgi:predicted nucleic acid-binding protein